MELIFASQNRNKAREIAVLFPSGITVLPLDAALFPEELPEPFEKLELNALSKAREVARRTGKPAFADDSGLEIEALDGAPGVYSARYAGEDKNADKNMDKVLRELQGKTNRHAQFRTVIGFVDGEKEFVFEGIVHGKILETKRGASGFGYDPIFKPDGYDRSFAEMPLEEKNKISHRAQAIRKFIGFLENRQD